MAKLNKNQIRELALATIEKHPGGIRYAELVNSILGAHPETPKSTIHGSVWNLASQFPSQINKPSRGLFVPQTKTRDVPIPIEPTPSKTAKIREDDFYEPFAKWLKSDLDEATAAAALGGSSMKAKWGTPDVVGVYKPLASHRI